MLEQKSALLGTARILRKIFEMKRRGYLLDFGHFVMTRLTEEMTLITTTRTYMLKTNNNNNNNKARGPKLAKRLLVTFWVKYRLKAEINIA